MTLPLVVYTHSAVHRLQREVCMELFGHGTVGKRYVLWQPVLEWWIGLALDQGRKICAACGGDVETVRADKRARQLLFLVGDFLERRHPNGPCIGLIGDAHNGRHDCGMALHGELDGRLAHRIGLLHIGLRGEMGRGALQIVQYCPVARELESGAQALRQDRYDSTQEGMTKRVVPPRCRHERAVGMAESPGDSDNTRAV